MGIFDFNINPLFKLYKKGDIVRLYKKMYYLAEELAIHEMDQKRLLITQDRINEKFKKATNNSVEDPKLTLLGDIVNFKTTRIEHHMNEMKKLLEMRIKEDKE